MIWRWLLRIEEWWDKRTGTPTRADVEAARQEWLAASRDLDATLEEALRKMRGDKVH